MCAHETNVAQSGPAVFEASCRLPRPASGPGVLQVAGSWWRRRGHRPASTSTSVMRNHHALPAARRHRRRRTSSSSIYAASPEGQLSMVAASGVPRGDDIGVESVGFVPPTGASAALLADRSTPRSGKPHAAPTASCVSRRPHHLQREPIRVTCWCSLRGVSAWRFPLARPRYQRERAGLLRIAGADPCTRPMRSREAPSGASGVCTDCPPWARRRRQRPSVGAPT